MINWGDMPTIILGVLIAEVIMRLFTEKFFGNTFELEKTRKKNGF